MINDDELNSYNSSDNNHIDTTSYCTCNCNCYDICFCKNTFCLNSPTKTKGKKSIQQDINFIISSDSNLQNDELKIMK